MKYKKLGDYIIEFSEKYDPKLDYPVYSVTNSNGFCTEYFNKDVSAKDKSKYKVVPHGYFAYNPSRINVGSVDWQKEEENVIVSPLYVIFKCSDILNQDYLKYFLKSNDGKAIIASKVSGSVRNNLNFKALSSIEFNIGTIEEQNTIVSHLKEIENAITNENKQIELYDELIKGRFVEMFGKVGSDPKGFGMKMLKDVCEINPKKKHDKRLRSGLEVSFVPMPAVSETGDIDATEIRTYDEVKTGFTYFAENDVLFAKITPCMENGKGAVAEGLCNEIGFGSTEFHVLRPIKEVSSPYWIYAITSFEMFRREAAGKMSGSAGQRRVPASFLEQYRVAVPPIDLQQQFATFAQQTNKSKFEAQKRIGFYEELLNKKMSEYFMD